MISNSSNEDRRKELGKAIFDIAKYMATVRLVSGFLTQTLTGFEAIIIVTLTLLAGIIAYIVIPS